MQVTYSLYDGEGALVDVRPVGDELHTFMSGSYRLEVNLDPPLVVEEVAIEKDATLRFDVVREGEGFRIEDISENVGEAVGEAAPEAPREAVAPDAPAESGDPPPDHLR